MCEDTCDTAALVISELVTNAIVHTASGVVVCELYDGDDLVRIAVRDEGCAPGEPHPSPQRPDEEHGRGLFLVDALCQSWGAQEHGPGLLVWADLPRRAEPTSCAASPERHDDLGASHPDSPERHDDLPASVADHPATAPPAPAPRADLGWGARPKPGPADGSDDEGETPAEQGDQADAAHRGPGPAEPTYRAHPTEGHTGARAPGHPYRPHHTPATDGRADLRSSGPLGRLPRLSDGPLSRVAPQWHRGPGTGGPSTPADHTDHALDMTSAVPSSRPHPVADPLGLPARDRDTA